MLNNTEALTAPDWVINVYKNHWLSVCVWLTQVRRQPGRLVLHSAGWPRGGSMDGGGSGVWQRVRGRTERTPLLLWIDTEAQSVAYKAAQHISPEPKQPRANPPSPCHGAHPHHQLVLDSLYTAEYVLSNKPTHRRIMLWTQILVTEIARIHVLTRVAFCKFLKGICQMSEKSKIFPSRQRRDLHNGMTSSPNTKHHLETTIITITINAIINNYFRHRLAVLVQHRLLLLSLAVFTILVHILD